MVCVLPVTGGSVHDLPLLRIGGQWEQRYDLEGPPEAAPCALQQSHPLIVLQSGAGADGTALLWM